MPRYFFHILDGERLSDLQGTEFPDLQAARQEAVRFSGELLKDHSGRFWDSGEWTMRVTDSANLTLFELHFVAFNAPSAQGH